MPKGTSSSSRERRVSTKSGHAFHWGGLIWCRLTPIVLQESSQLFFFFFFFYLFLWFFGVLVSFFYQLFGFFSLCLYIGGNLSTNGTDRVVPRFMSSSFSWLNFPARVSFSSDLGVSSTPITTTSFSFAFHFLIWKIRKNQPASLFFRVVFLFFQLHDRIDQQQQRWRISWLPERERDTGTDAHRCGGVFDFQKGYQGRIVSFSPTVVIVCLDGLVVVHQSNNHSSSC